MNLATLQQQFQDFVLAAHDAQAPVHAAVLGDDAAQRLGVYHHAYRARLHEALAESYALTWTYVGDTHFEQLCAGYVAAHPSPFTNLRWYGGAFAAHVRAELPDHPYVAELASLEWALGLAFDAADATPIDPAAVGDWAAATFALHPSAQLLELHWNTAAIWQALKDELEPPAPGAAAPVSWLVWRGGEQPMFRSLSAGEARALRLIAAGASFGAVADGAAGDDPDGTAALAGWLRGWLDAGLLVPAAA